MLDPQGLLVDFARDFSQGTAAVVFILGLLYALQGFRFARVLLAISCAAAGWLLGGTLSSLVTPLGIPAIVPAGGAAVLLGIQPLVHYRIGVIIASMCTFAFIAFDLTTRVLDLPQMALSAAIGGALAGGALYWLHRRCLPLLLTAIHGALLVLMGFVGLSSNVLPGLADTFASCARDWPLLLPVLLSIVCITGYTVQLNAYQGDIVVGGGRGWNSPERL